MTDSLIGFFVFWGIWLLIPLLVDGGTAVFYLVGGFRMNRGRHHERQRHVLSNYPKVSIIVPVYNGEAVVGACLDSIMAQNYPQDRLEVIVVDNLSSDQTLDVVREKQPDAPKNEESDQRVGHDHASSFSRVVGAAGILRAGQHGGILPQLGTRQKEPADTGWSDRYLRC